MPHSNTANSPTGPAPIITTSVLTVISLLTFSSYANWSAEWRGSRGDATPPGLGICRTGVLRFAIFAPFRFSGTLRPS